MSPITGNELPPYLAGLSKISKTAGPVANDKDFAVEAVVTFDDGGCGTCVAHAGNETLSKVR
jgi:hypothetical protein